MVDRRVIDSGKDRSQSLNLEKELEECWSFYGDGSRTFALKLGMEHRNWAESSLA